MAHLETWNAGLAASYDRTAERYAETFFDELDRKPYDRALLDRFAAEVAGRGPVCDLGCGPGHVGRYLQARGIDVFGVDLAPGMVAVAARLNPDIPFHCGDMRSLDLPDDALGGVAAFYSLIHLAREEATQALQEIYGVLQPGGRLLAAFHGGDGEVHSSEFLGLPVAIDATFFQPEEMAGYARAAGFTLDVVTSRPAYAFEYPSTRVYLAACK